MDLTTYLDRAEQRYDPTARLVWVQPRTGYHTAREATDQVHGNRASADYALALLQAAPAGGDGRLRERANDILDALVAVQVTDPTGAHFGIWGWFAEETPAQMSPADWNWADFIGARLAQVLALHGDQLRGPTAAAVRGALRRAALAIFRRNVTPRYTNIAVMGAVVTAAAGELLDTPFLVEYGRRRLGNVLELTEQAGSFEEYNSPTYTRVALEELERAAALVTDPQLRATADALWRVGWRTLAERFHPGTGQLAGPQSRAYHDWLFPNLAGWLTRRTGVTITPRPGVADGPELVPDLVPALPCPPELAQRFATLPADPSQVRTRFAVTDGAGETIGTTWLTSGACLGTVNQDHSWQQRRVLLGYWRTPDDPAVCLRARMLLDGEELTAAWVRQAQDGPRVLAGWWLSYDSGYTHPYFDKPAGSLFTVGDLRLRLSLCGVNTRVARLRDDRYELVAGDWRALVQLGHARLDGRAGQVEISHDDQGSRLDVVLHRGPAEQVDFHHAALRLGYALELRRSGDPVPDPQPVRSDVDDDGSGDDDGSRDDDEIQWRWRDLRVTTPAAPTRFDAPSRVRAGSGSGKGVADH